MLSGLTAMTFHCITAGASAVAGGAADAPTMPSVPRSAPIATAMNQTDRLWFMNNLLFRSLDSFGHGLVGGGLTDLDVDSDT